MKIPAVKVYVGQYAELDECGHQRVTMARRDVKGVVILRGEHGCQITFAPEQGVEVAA